MSQLSPVGSIVVAGTVHHRIIVSWPHSGAYDVDGIRVTVVPPLMVMTSTMVGTSSMMMMSSVVMVSSMMVPPTVVMTSPTSMVTSSSSPMTMSSTSHLWWPSFSAVQMTKGSIIVGTSFSLTTNRKGCHQSCVAPNFLKNGHNPPLLNIKIK